MVKTIESRCFDSDNSIRITFTDGDFIIANPNDIIFNFPIGTVVYLESLDPLIIRAANFY